MCQVRWGGRQEGQWPCSHRRGLAPAEDSSIQLSGVCAPTVSQALARYAGFRDECV